MLVLAVILALILCVLLARMLPLLGCALSLVLSIACLFAASAAGDVLALCLAPGIFLVTCLWLSAVPDEDGQTWQAKRLARGILYSVLGFMVVILAAMLMGPAASFGILLVLILVAGVFSRGRSARWSTSLAVCSTLAACMRQNLPLPMALEMAASDRRDWAGHTFRRIKDWLVQGYSVAESIQLGYPKCPSHALGLIKAADQAGQLPQGLACATESIRFKARNREAIAPVHPLYPVLILTAVCFVSTGILIYVMPEFSSVTKEMLGGELPLATRLLIRFGSDLAGYFLVTVAVLLLLYLVWRVLRWADQREGEAAEPPLLVFDMLRWYTPILHWFDYQFNMVQLCETLKMSLQSGCTVDQAIDSCLVLDLNRWFKRRVAQWYSRVAAGEDVAGAARQCRLAHPLAWAFDTRVNQGNTLNVLALLERFYRSNYSYYNHLAKCTLPPVITLLLAALVCFIVLGIFSPAVGVLHGMADIYP